MNRSRLYQYIRLSIYYIRSYQIDILIEERLLIVDRIRLSTRLKKKLDFSISIDALSVVGLRSSRILQLELILFFGTLASLFKSLIVRLVSRQSYTSLYIYLSNNISFIQHYSIQKHQTKPLSTKRKATYKREDILKHFSLFERAIC